MMPGIRLATMIGVVWLAACDTSEGPADANLLEFHGQPKVIFLTMSEPPTAMMDALLDGPIVPDEAGCLRHGPDNHTVIWPHGYTIEAEGNVITVRDAVSDAVGQIGERFKLSGGELLFLHDGLPLSDRNRELAEEECPGRYWLVGAPVIE